MEEVQMTVIGGPKSCDECLKEFKNQGGLNLHKKRAHRKVVDIKAEPAEPKIVKSQSPLSVAPVSVTFLSPKAHKLQVIVTPARRVERNYPGADGVPVSMIIQTEEKLVEFQAGKFETSDPEIITFLETKYKDNRYPVISTRLIKEA